MTAIQVDLTNCDREPIHIPGSIQPHGALLAFDSGFVAVTRYSANIAKVLPDDGHADFMGRHLENIFGDAMAHNFRNALAKANISGRPSLLLGLDIRGRAFDIAIHGSGNEVIVECEPVAEDADQPLDIARSLIGQVGGISDMGKLVTNTARLVRATLGYDRVMIYRFEEDGAGQVVAESKVGHLESFMGQYFPASDIPQQARALYLKNTIRIISDSGGAKVDLVPVATSASGELDLSFAHLRSVSPIHLEYLRNMGVAASMSISIIVDNALWGLIACHHYSPKLLSMAERIASEMFGNFFSLHLDVLRQKQKIDTASNARRSLDLIMRRAPAHDDIVALLRDTLPEFAQMVPCDGIGLLMESEWYGIGTTPGVKDTLELTRFIGQQGEPRTWSTHILPALHPGAATYSADVSGVLAVPLSQRPRDYLIFFRKELVQTLNWGGDPNKSYETGPMGDRLTPRKSFAIWKETVQNQSQRWSEAEIETAEAIRSALVETVLRHNEILAEERSKADVRQRMLNEELNHRVKNILAVIKSLVSQPNPAGRTLEEYLAILRGRIDALAIAHDQIARGDGGGFLLDLLKAELEPYRDQNLSIVHKGPPIWLDTRAFSVMALVFHELSTNSAKYGALSSEDGRLDITWRETADGGCALDWQESGGPRVTPPQRKGFGTILITRSIPYDLGGQSEVNYDPSGLKAHFSLPSRHVAIVGTDSPDESAGQGRDQENSGNQFALQDIAILLVEDQMLIAMDVEMMLSDAGLTNVVIAGSSAEALRQLKSRQPVVAILDVNLGSETSFEVATELRRMEVPFLFATGYGDSSIISDGFAGVPVIRKPYSSKTLIPVILNLIKT